jgi:hypothetical protein
MRSRRVPSASKRFGALRPQTGRAGFINQLDRFWPDNHIESSALALWLSQATQSLFGEPLQTPRTRCSLCQSPLMTWLPRSPGSALVLRLNHETVHNFVLLFLIPLDTGSLEPSLLVFSTPGGLTGNDLLRLLFTCTNTSQAATCTCSTYPRVGPHNVVNHSSYQEATIHRSSNHTGPHTSCSRSYVTCCKSLGR